MNTDFQPKVPLLLRQLADRGCLAEADLHRTEDGLWAANRSLSDILAEKQILTFPGDSDAQLECRLFFDDWFLYAVPSGEDFVYSLFKMREQEHDALLGLRADGDIPGVTISFIALQSQVLLACLDDPEEENRKRLGQEINRVVAYRGQRHSPVLRAYFLRTEAQGAYLIARLYTNRIAAFSRDGRLPVPECYRPENHKRIARFLEENNRAAGRTVCDHSQLYFRDQRNLSIHERLAILATHTANVSFFSFAAEVQFHARFLQTGIRRIPVLGKSVYASAIRADMSISDREFTGPTPYYQPNSAIVKKQAACHGRSSILL